MQFGWLVTDTAVGALQRSYQVTVRDDVTDDLLWDSGRVDDPRQTGVEYDGGRLAGDTAYRWTVASAGADGRLGPASTPAVFVTGLRADDWPASARWLRPGPASPPLESYTYVRTRLDLQAGRRVSRATAYIAAAHKYQLWVNGAMVDSGPSFSYPDESYVQATDLTGVLPPGANGVGVLHHWYGPGQGRPASAPGLLMLVSVHYDGGGRDTFVTDGAWRRARRPSGCPPRSATATAATSWSGSTAACNRWVGPRRRSTTAPGTRRP